MHGIPITGKEISRIKHLRRTGHSLPEICSLVQRGNSTVFKYIQGIKVLAQYQTLLREKQGGSKKRSQISWEKARKQAKSILFPFQKEGLILFIVALYWAEGGKRELNLINSDPELVRIFIKGLFELGVKKSDLRVNLRLYGDIKESAAKAFWAQKLGILPESILGVNWLRGKKKGRLPYGMCRVRVVKSGDYFKMIMSGIEHVKEMW